MAIVYLCGIAVEERNRIDGVLGMDGHREMAFLITVRLDETAQTTVLDIFHFGQDEQINLEI